MAKKQVDDDLDFPDDTPGEGSGNDGLPSPEDLQVDTEGTPADAVEVEVVDDTPPADKGRQPLRQPVEDPTEEELQKYSADTRRRIEKLTHARHDERRAREALERQHAELSRVAQTLLEDNKQLRGVVDNGSEQYIKTAVSLAEKNVAAAQESFKSAQESFDADAIVKAQSDLMDAKIALQDAKKMRPTALQTEKPVVQTRELDSGADQIDSRTLRWQEDNQWFGRTGNEPHTAFALGLHQQLLNSGYDPRSEAYFEQIDARLKETFPGLYKKSTAEQRDAPPSRTSKPASVVAPATRTTSPRKVQLTATQVALANRLGLTPQQYAVELAKSQKES